MIEDGNLMKINYKKQKYLIFTTTKGVEEVEGYVFTHSGFEGYQFGVHKEGENNWFAIELSTGSKICGDTTRRGVLENFKIFSSIISRPKLANAIQGRVKDSDELKKLFPLNSTVESP